MVGRLDIRDNLRDDERRRRDEARLAALEEQVAALRVALQESNSRQARIEEGRKALEEDLDDLTRAIEAVRTEARGFNAAREADVTRERQAIDDLDQRIAGLTSPIPTLRAQLAELGNQMRAGFQELGQDRHQIGELQARIDRLPPQVERGIEIARGVRDELAAIRAEIDSVRAAWHKTSDAIGIVEQDLRRRSGDMLAKLEETNNRIESLRDELPPLDVQIDRVRHELHQALPRFDELTMTDAALREEIDRIAALDFDRHVQALARADEARTGVDERVRVVERLNDTRFSSTMARFAELEEADQALGHRITMLAMQLDALRDQDAAIRVEMRRIEELRLRVRLEQAQQEARVFSERLAEIQSGLDGSEEDGDG